MEEAGWVVGGEGRGGGENEATLHLLSVNYCLVFVDELEVSHEYYWRIKAGIIISLHMADHSTHF